MSTEIRLLEFDREEMYRVRDCLAQLTRVYENDNQYWNAAILRRMEGMYRHFVAVSDGVVVGTATLFVEQKLGGVAGHIEDVVVDASCRSRGIGKMLVDRCVEEARLAGAYKVVLSCSEDVQAFYQRCGFYLNGIAMRQDLDQSEGTKD